MSNGKKVNSEEKSVYVSPLVLSLNDKTNSRGECSTGSGDDDCTSGNDAFNFCNPVGNSAEYCQNGNDPNVI
jgi:hypothetical protein